MKRSEVMRFIQGLSAEEGSRVLKALLNDEPLLAKKIYDMAVKVADDVDADAIMNRV